MGTATASVKMPSSPDDIAEVIARLDAFERALAGMVLEVRQMKLDLFETLDRDLSAVVD